MNTAHNRIVGTVHAQAYPATGTDGSAWLTVIIDQAHEHAARYHAKQNFGTGHAAQFAAANAARRLSRGARVIVHYQSADIRLSPQPHVVLWGVDHIEQLALPAHHATPEQEAA